jgi:hypothetical protein
MAEAAKKGEATMRRQGVPELLGEHWHLTECQMRDALKATNDDY